MYHVCYSLDVTTLRQHIASALWRAYPQLHRRQSCLRRSALWYEGRKISALLAQNFQLHSLRLMNDIDGHIAIAKTPLKSVFCTFSVEPLVVYNCVVEFKSVAPLLRYSTCKYTVTLKPGLGATQGHQKLYHSIQHP